jgi:hypothetical protein
LSSIAYTSAMHPQTGQVWIVRSSPVPICI